MHSVPPSFTGLLEWYHIDGGFLCVSKKRFAGCYEWCDSSRSIFFHQVYDAILCLFCGLCSPVFCTHCQKLQLHLVSCVQVSYLRCVTKFTFLWFDLNKKHILMLIMKYSIKWHHYYFNFIYIKNFDFAELGYLTRAITPAFTPQILISPSTHLGLRCYPNPLYAHI